MGTRLFHVDVKRLPTAIEDIEDMLVHSTLITGETALVTELAEYEVISYPMRSINEVREVKEQRTARASSERQVP